MQVQLRIVDLFSGCGGFSLGAHAAGLAPQLAFDVDPILTSAFASNHPNAKLVLTDLSEATGLQIEREVGGRVDGVFGGPPCQAFSEIGYRKADDPRRSLLGHFFRLVAELRPAFFVMENVKGLGYADARPLLDGALELLPGEYRILGPLILDAADFGAATRRRRLFVIGYLPDRVKALTQDDINAARREPANVRAAIADLSSATMIGEIDGYDLWRIRQLGPPSKYAARLHSRDKTFTSHRRTAHTLSVAARFDKIAPGGIDAVGRHPRLDWNGQCPTLRAGTGSDRGSFQAVRPIHPDEPRVITVREAARLQGFPDNFLFHTTIWHSFRMIGNSVSPILAQALFSLIAARVEKGAASPVAAE